MRSVVGVNDRKLLVGGLQLRGGPVSGALEGNDRSLKAAQPLVGTFLIPLRLPGIPGLAQSRPDAVLKPIAWLAVPLKYQVRGDAGLIQPVG